MKYLTYFRLNKELTNLILNQNNIILPGSGLHSTLCYFHMESERENYLLEDLSKIKFDLFKIETKEFEDFDNNSLVLKLSKPEELIKLHRNIVLSARKYANQGFDEIAIKYFYENYNPHLTISKSSSNFDRKSNLLLGLNDIISRYHLAKKIDGNWRQIQTFFYNAEKK